MNTTSCADGLDNECQNPGEVTCHICGKLYCWDHIIPITLPTRSLGMGVDVDACHTCTMRVVEELGGFLAEANNRLRMAGEPEEWPDDLNKWLGR